MMPSISVAEILLAAFIFVGLPCMAVGFFLGWLL